MKPIVSRSIGALVLLTLVLAAGIAEAKPAAVKLEYKLKMGDTLKYRIALDGDTTMAVADKKESEKVKVDMAFEETVLHIAKDNGNLDLQITIKEAKATASNGQVTDLAEQIGKTVYATMKPNGEMMGVTSFDPNFDPNQMSIPFPEKPIAIGYSWTQSVKAGNQIPVPIEAKYTFEEMTELKGRKVAVIAEEIAIPDSEKKKGIVARSTGKLYFDYEAGLILRNHLTMDMTMIQNLQNDNPKLGPPVKVVTTRVKMTTKMELEEK